MVGIYFHIPFCVSKCHYCNFYSVVDTKNTQFMQRAMLHEVALRQDYFASHYKQNTPFQASLYFGGGTPSLMPVDALDVLAKKAIDSFKVDDVSEFTVELNPDDATPQYLEKLRGIGVNRISLGVQSFFDEDLQFANRRHTAQQAKQCIRDAQKIGFDNISVDLIYGLPDLNISRWQKNLEILLSLDIQHISAYSLSLEEGTVFAQWLKKKRIELQTDTEITAQYDLLCTMAQQKGFVHYETSNFALPSHFAQHNTAYWQDVPYIGIGAAAHSFNGVERQSNLSSNTLYMNNLEKGGKYYTLEKLNAYQRYNEVVSMGLRTIWGVSLQKIKIDFGEKLLNYCLQQAERHIKMQNIEIDSNIMKIPHNRWFVADSIVVDLMWA
ncbi:MAG: radical SAM family heme chaperone HemW [Bacteroidales bacterium]